jgi:hypothetical protein
MRELREGLIARDLPQLPVLEVIAAAVTHLNDVEPGPDDDAHRERRRHLASVELHGALLLHAPVRLDGRFTKCGGEFVFRR